MAVTIQVRRDTSANWISLNPVLHQGEPGFETDTGRHKIGDGSTAWTSLGYAAQQLTPTTQAAAYTASPGDYVKANVSSAGWTLKLPQAPPPNAIVGAKVIANAATGALNTLTVQCQGSDVFEASGGSTSTTLYLPNQAAAWQYNGGYWTRLSDDLPLGQLNSLYANVFSPMAYGAKGNGTTDDTAAVQAAFAAAIAAQGTVDLGTHIFLTSSPVTLHSGVLVKGASILGSGSGQITNSTSDLFTVSGSVGHVTFRDCTLVSGSGGGHIFNMSDGTASMSFWTMTGVQALQNNTGKGIWYQLGGAILDSLWGDDCFFEGASGATVSPFTINGGSFTNLDIASLVFRRMRVEFAGSGGAAPFFSLDRQSSTGWSTEVIFDQVTFEQTNAGAIYATAATDWQIRYCALWDAPAITANEYSFSRSSAGYACADIRITGGEDFNASRLGGYHTLYADSYTYYLCIDSFNAIHVSSPAEQTVFINMNTVTSNGPAAIAAPILSSAGLSGATAASRYVGATASGAPTGSNPFLTGDFVVDQTGTMWICTAGGSPGMWAAAGGSGFASATDPMQIGFDSTYLHGTAGAGTAPGAMTAQYGRLLAAGYAMSHWTIQVTASSGNISVGLYAGSGSGASAVPTGAPTTSGAVACPAIGVTTITLGATVTPTLAYWGAVSADNGTAAMILITDTANTTMMAGLGCFTASHTDSSCSTQGTTTVLDASASSTFVGYGISCTGNIPANTTITGYSTGVSYTISNAATTTASGLSFIIGAHPLVSSPSVTSSAGGTCPFMKGS
jgi:Major tropism determinant N-terminal domain